MNSLLIFDLDGTLVDSRADIRTGVNLTRAHYGLAPLAIETVAGFIGNGTRKLIERAFAETPVDIDEALDINNRFYNEHLHDATRPYPGVLSGLEELGRAGNTLAVLTNKPSPACRAILHHFKIMDAFAAVLGGDSTPKIKPDPEPVFMIMQSAGFAAADTWMIGDNYTDIDAAHGANIRSAFVTYGFGQAGANKPTRAFDSFDELTRFFVNQ